MPEFVRGNRRIEINIVTDNETIQSICLPPVSPQASLLVCSPPPPLSVFSDSLSLCLSVSVSLPLFLSLSVCLSLSTIYFCLSFPTLSDCLFLLSLYLCLSLSVCPSVSVCLSLSLLILLHKRPNIIHNRGLSPLCLPFPIARQTLRAVL